MMSNLALKIIDDAIADLEFEQPNCESFRIDNDEKAEWALAKIREEQAEAMRIMNVCKSMILHYEQQMKKAEENLEKKTAYLRSQLEQYFDSVEKRRTKTQEVYKLPSGTLKRKYPGPQFKRDDEKLISWLKARQMNEYIKVKESPDWANLKKVAQVAGDKIVDENGEVVEGITVVDRPPVFEVEV
jgi:hypothetical protein